MWVSKNLQMPMNPVDEFGNTGVRRGMSQLASIISDEGTHTEKYFLSSVCEYGQRSAGISLTDAHSPDAIRAHVRIQNDVTSVDSTTLLQRNHLQNDVPHHGVGGGNGQVRVSSISTRKGPRSGIVKSQKRSRW